MEIGTVYLIGRHTNHPAFDNRTIRGDLIADGATLTFAPHGIFSERKSPVIAIPWVHIKEFTIVGEYVGGMFSSEGTGTAFTLRFYDEDYAMDTFLYLVKMGLTGWGIGSHDGAMKICKQIVQKRAEYIQTTRNQTKLKFPK